MKFFAALLLTLLMAGTALAELTVTRSAVARSVIGREPEGAAQAFPANVGKVVFFNQLSGAAKPEDVTHLWKYAGKVELAVKLEVEEEGWRIWSVKEIPPNQTGNWTVEAVDAAGTVLETAAFTVGP